MRVFSSEPALASGAQSTGAAASAWPCVAAHRGQSGLWAPLPSGGQSACQCGEPSRQGVPPLGRGGPCSGERSPLQCSCLGVPEQRSPGGRKESGPPERKTATAAAKAVVRRELCPPGPSVEGPHPQCAVPSSFQRGQGAPAREPIISSEEQKQLMLYYHRRQEELKVLRDGLQQGRHWGVHPSPPCLTQALGQLGAVGPAGCGGGGGGGFGAAASPTLWGPCPVSPCVRVWRCPASPGRRGVGRLVVDSVEHFPGMPS